MHSYLDQFAKTVAAGGTRRQMLRWTGGLFGGLLAMAGLGQARADCEGCGVPQAVQTICHDICTECKNSSSFRGGNGYGQCYTSCQAYYLKLQDYYENEVGKAPALAKHCFNP